MKLGDQPAFPLPATDHMHYAPGMTYRQWLVGQIASGWQHPFGGYCDESVREVIGFADAIIKRLEEK